MMNLDGMWRLAPKRLPWDGIIDSIKLGFSVTILTELERGSTI
jgi:hypothetical protein